MPAGLRIRVAGQVQGVGFRPFVWRLARRMGLAGHVLNDAAGVLIEVAGADLPGFLAALRAEAPPLARIDRIETHPAEITDAGFHIHASGPAGARTRVAPDAATCPSCLAEIRGTGRRRGYAFTNCTDCGPRFSIVTALPYDRANTTMAGFAICAECGAEYGDPGDRRFHAQPIACPSCGPRLWLEQDGAEMAGDPIAQAAARIAGGGIVAVKGLGGFHLACDAGNAAALAALRRRKARPAKPFALMAPLAVIRRHAVLDAEAEALLSSSAAPILLLPIAGTPLPGLLAPGLDALGWMLPATPLHHLLCDALDRPLVMTSANRSGAPMVTDTETARRDLSGIADAILTHDRAVARRLDDSVLRPGPAGPLVIRRARGLVPGTLPLPPGLPDAQVLAMGGEMKAALCLTRDGQALLGHHLGDLSDAANWEAYLQAEADYTALFEHGPQAVAVDLHPDFRASRHGAARAAERDLPLIRVQHHHAHMAAALGEAGWQGRVAVGVILDGLGLGPDGTVWGGEVLAGDYREMRGVAHLAPAALIGGDRAQSEPWRNALVRLDAAGLGALADRLFAGQPLALARQAAAKGLNAPPSASAGRLFDAVAACLGLCPARQSYEGEAAMRLEALADAEENGAYAFGLGDGSIDPAPMFAELAADLARGIAPGVIAARFQSGLAQAFAAAARAAAEAAGTDTIALSGGCFQNVALLAATCRALEGFRLCLPGQVPAGDGGLAYGQALVALARLESA